MKRARVNFKKTLGPPVSKIGWLRIFVKTFGFWCWDRAVPRINTCRTNTDNALYTRLSGRGHRWDAELEVALDHGGWMINVVADPCDERREVNQHVLVGDGSVNS